MDVINQLQDSPGHNLGLSLPNVDKLERIQQRATKMIGCLGNTSHEEKLEELGFISSGEEKTRGRDLITASKYMKRDKIVVGCSLWLQETRQKITALNCRKGNVDIRKNFLITRVVKH